MTCDAARRALHERMDGAITPPQENELDAHLLRCPACREVARDSASLRNGLTALDQLGPLEWDQRGARRSRVVLRWARFAPIGVAAAVMLLASLLIAFRVRVSSAALSAGQAFHI